MMKIQNDPYVNPYQLNFIGINREKKALDERILQRCVRWMVKRILKRLDERTLEPYDVETAINGARTDPFLRRMDMSKSAGHGLPGKKGKYFSRHTGDAVYDEPDEVIKEKIADFWGMVERGESPTPIFSCQLKDEPRAAEKVAKGKTRLFYMSPLVFLVLCRMYLSPFYTAMVEQSDVFMTAIGIDMTRQAHKLIENVFPDGTDSDVGIEWDYEKYDQAMPFGIGRAACSVIYRVLESKGYGTHALSCVSSLLTSCLFIAICLLGDIFIVAGLQPSGKYATAEDNSLRNVILMLYFWFSNATTEGFDFDDYVRIKTYGDDIFGWVHPRFRKEINNVTFNRFSNDFFGMNTTSAAKDGKLNEFVPASEISFLKRKFVYHKTLKRKVGALSTDSIFRMLQWSLPSDSVSESDQAKSVCSSALYEVALHTDEARYNKFRNYLKEKMTKFVQYDEDEIEGFLLTWRQVMEKLSDVAVDDTVVILREDDGKEESQFASTL
jgi:hypothetical protein